MLQHGLNFLSIPKKGKKSLPKVLQNTVNLLQLLAIFCNPFLAHVCKHFESWSWKMPAINYIVVLMKMWSIILFMHNAQLHGTPGSSSVKSFQLNAKFQDCLHFHYMPQKWIMLPYVYGVAGRGVWYVWGRKLRYSSLRLSGKRQTFISPVTTGRGNPVWKDIANSGPPREII